MTELAAKSPMCPCCDAEDARFAFLHTFALDISSSHSVSYDARYWACSRCDHIWYVPERLTIDETMMFEYYQNKRYSDTPLQKGDRNHTSLTQLVKLLAPFLTAVFAENEVGRKKINVLEIGGGDGSFARVFLEYYAQYDVKFLILDHHQFVDQDPPFERVSDIPNVPFDLVIARHTLEHVLSPAQFANSISEALAENGHCYMEVPCWTLPYYSVDELNPEHFQQFTHSSIDALFMGSTDLVPVGDFSIYLRDYYTPNRILGKIYRKDAPLRITSNADAFNQAIEFGKRHRLARLHLHTLANRIGAAATAGKTIGLHGATITFSDFAINEGAALMSLNNIFMFDGSTEKHGHLISGMPIHKPDNAYAKKIEVLFCFSSYLHEIEAEWRALGYQGEFRYYLS
jgi:hypothetical protein